MEIFPVGLVLYFALLGLGWYLGSATVIGLFASFAFGATAVFAVGNATPLIYTMFVLLLFGQVILRPRFIEDLASLFRQQWLPWVVLGLVIYVIAGALILPRIFAGQMTVFVPQYNAEIETLLAPVSGNFTQAAYFALSALTFIAFSIILLEKRMFRYVGLGFLVFATLHALLGWTDLGAKLLGASDILEPIRTAGYLMHTQTEAAGLWRVSGGFSEASAFGSVGVACLAFTFIYWRLTGSRYALAVSVALLGIVLLSTSAAAYVALTVSVAALLGSMGYSALVGRLTKRDLTIAVCIFAGLVASMAMHLADEQLLEPVVKFVNGTVIHKSTSASGIERLYWNIKSLQAFSDTGGLGIGIGSSRASSLFLAVLSQLGAIGFLALMVLIAVLIRGSTIKRPSLADFEVFAVSQAIRAAALVSLVTANLIGGSADPGPGFFIAIAIVVASQRYAIKGSEQLDWNLIGSVSRRQRPHEVSARTLLR
jgi:hypothetical protein